MSGEWQCHASGHCLRRAAQDPSGAAPSSSLGPLGTGKRDNQTLSPSVTSCVCGHGEEPPRDGCCIGSGGKLHPLRSLKVLGGRFGGLVYQLVHACLKKEGWAAGGGEVNKASCSQRQGFGG